MTNTLTLEAQAKEQSGKSHAKAARKSGMLPAVIYGGSHKEVMVNLPFNEFFKEYQKGGLQAKLTEVKLGNKKITTIVRAVQLDPVTDFPIHIDLQEVSKDTVIRVAVNIKIVNEEKCVPLKRGAVLNVSNRTIAVFCSPHSIPKNIEVDISNLTLGHPLHINDISLPEGVTPCDKSNAVIASLSGSSEEDSVEESVE